MPPIDIFIRMTMIRDKVTKILDVRRNLIAIKADLRVLLTLFNVKTTENSNLDNFLVNRTVTQIYRVLQAIRANQGRCTPGLHWKHIVQQRFW